MSDHVGELERLLRSRCGELAEKQTRITARPSRKVS
jgi:hypothetical protein